MGLANPVLAAGDREGGRRDRRRPPGRSPARPTSATPTRARPTCVHGGGDRRDLRRGARGLLHRVGQPRHDRHPHRPLPEADPRSGPTSGSRPASWVATARKIRAWGRHVARRRVDRRGRRACSSTSLLPSSWPSPRGNIDSADPVMLAAHPGRGGPGRGGPPTSQVIDPEGRCPGLADRSLTDGVRRDRLKPGSPGRSRRSPEAGSRRPRPGSDLLPAHPVGVAPACACRACRSGPGAARR